MRVLTNSSFNPSLSPTRMEWQVRVQCFWETGGAGQRLTEVQIGAAGNRWDRATGAAGGLVDKVVALGLRVQSLALLQTYCRNLCFRFQWGWLV